MGIKLGDKVIQSDWMKYSTDDGNMGKVGEVVGFDKMAEEPHNAVVVQWRDCTTTQMWNSKERLSSIVVLSQSICPGTAVLIHGRAFKFTVKPSDFTSAAALRNDGKRFSIKCTLTPSHHSAPLHTTTLNEATSDNFFALDMALAKYVNSVCGESQVDSLNCSWASIAPSKYDLESHPTVAGWRQRA